MSRVRGISICVVVAILISGVGVASAQGSYSASFDPEQFVASADPDQISLVDGARTQARGSLGVGIAFHLAGPQLGICIRDAGSSDPSCRLEGDLLSSRLRADLGMLYGFGRFDVRLSLPLVLYQTTDFSAPTGEEPLGAFGVGNPRLGLRFRLARLGPLNLAADVASTIPTGNSNFIGDQGVIVDPRLLVDVRRGRFGAGVNLGYRFRQESAQMADLYVDDEVTWSAAVEVWLSPRLALGAAAYGRIGLMNAPADPMDLAAAPGAIGPEERPAEALASVRYLVNRRIAVDVGGGAGLNAGYGAPPFRVLAGVRWIDQKAEAPRARGRVRVSDRDKDGVADADDQCPKEAEDADGFEDVDGCPDADNDGDGIADGADGCPLAAEDKDGIDDGDGCPDATTDRDGDGIADGADRCPAAAEDQDGVQDADGCPEADADGDGVADAADGCDDQAEDVDSIQDEDGCPEADADGDGLKDTLDKCPLESEVFNGSDDDDGCADAGKELAVVEGDAVVITEKIFFDLNRARIRRRSHPVLDAVAGILRAHSDLRIRIEGHTDDRGTADWNRTLSQLRSERVREYLIKEGIARDRLESQGFGADRPLVPGTSEPARDKNRRVEFVIVGRTEQP